MSENNVLSVSYSGDTECFVSKTAKKRMKDEFKKINLNSENKLNFENYENLRRFIKESHTFDIVDLGENKYEIKLLIDEKKALKDKCKEKLKMLKNQRCNTYGRKINSMKKEVGGDVMDKFLAAQKSMQNYPIPDPSEIMKNKEKYLKEFSEYEQMIKTMSKNDPNSQNVLNKMPYHKYAEEILKMLKK